MWSANEFFYSPAQESGRDVYTPAADAPPRGYYHLPEPVDDVYTLAQATADDRLPSASDYMPGALPPHQLHNRPRSPYDPSGSHGQLPLLQLPEGYAGAAPLIRPHGQDPPPAYAPDYGHGAQAALIGSQHAQAQPAYTDYTDYRNGAAAASLMDSQAHPALADYRNGAAAASLMGSQAHPALADYRNGAAAASMMVSQAHPALADYRNAGAAAPLVASHHGQALPSYADYRSGAAAAAAPLAGSQLQPAYADYRSGAAAAAAPLAGSQLQPAYADYRNGAALASPLVGGHAQPAPAFTAPIVGSQYQPASAYTDYRNGAAAAAAGPLVASHNQLPPYGDYRNAAPSMSQAPLPYSSAYSSPASISVPLPPSVSRTYPDMYAHPGPLALPLAESNYSQKTVELQVPICCEDCGDRIKDALIDLEGVRGVSLDFEHEKVTIVGNVNAAQALKRLKALKPKGGHRIGTKKIMYRN